MLRNVGNIFGNLSAILEVKEWREVAGVDTFSSSATKIQNAMQWKVEDFPKPKKDTQNQKENSC